MWRYLPRDTDNSAYCQVFTRDPVTIWEAHKSCTHPVTTYFDFTDLRSDNMQRWTGQCCTACGRIMSIEAVQ